MTPANPVGITGIAFIEIATREPRTVRRTLRDLGMARTQRHRRRKIDRYEQNAVTILVNHDPATVGAKFAAAHGPSICSIGLAVKDPAAAFDAARARGGEPALSVDYDVPAIHGIGGTLLYFVRGELPGFLALPSPDAANAVGLLAIDHLTNNVPFGTMADWVRFYEQVLGFEQVRTFHIRGTHTGLSSFALRSPCGTFSIPINEASEKKSQINEFLDEHRGPGVQHVAFLTGSLLGTLHRLERSPIRFLDVEPSYYDQVFTRVPGVTEDRSEIARRNVLVDGDESGYLLQIFTQNLLGPSFFELIQRKNHLSFGEGNFGALFRSIERDQARRGVFNEEGP